MSQLKLDPTWILELSTPDLRLVLQALGGRLKPESVEEARLLGDRLTLDRVNATQREINVLRNNVGRQAADSAGPKS
jgi:hypothetical protein